MFITLQGRLSNTHTHTVFALLVNWGILIKNWSAICCVSLLRNSLPLCHAPLCLTCTHTHAHTIYAHRTPAWNPDLSNKTTPFCLEYLRCKHTNAPAGETGNNIRVERDDDSESGKADGLRGETSQNQDGVMWMKRTGWKGNHDRRGEKKVERFRSDDCLCSTSLSTLDSAPRSSVAPSLLLSSSQTPALLQIITPSSSIISPLCRCSSQSIPQTTLPFFSSLTFSVVDVFILSFPASKPGLCKKKHAMSGINWIQVE